jgi:hypothetical protein
METKNTYSVNPNENAGIAGERRQDRRYDIRLDVKWKLIRRRRVLETGIGHTIDLSSGGVHFETDRPLPIGLNVELSIAWPALLHNLAPLQLVAFGKIVRCSGGRTAMQMDQHEFRTAGIAADRSHNTPNRPPSAFLGYNSGIMNLGKMH